MRLGAVLSVKDEMELIGPAIAHLRAIGVDHVIAIDMGSTDGTLEILQTHRSEADFWVTRLSDATPDHFESWSRVAVALLRSARLDWAIFLDADEFWLPESGSLKNCAGLMDADLLHVKRYNVAVPPDGRFFDVPALPAQYGDIPLLAPADGLQAADAPWIMAAPEEKLCVRPELTAAAGLGAHDVIARPGARLRRRNATDVLVAHLPFTTEARFARKIANIRKIFATHDRAFGESVAFHWRRWLELQETGRLAEEVAASTFTPAAQEALRHAGHLRNVADLLKTLAHHAA